MRTPLLLLVLGLFLNAGISAQNTTAPLQCWSAATLDQIDQADHQNRPLRPSEFTVQSFNMPQLRQALKNAPMEFTAAARQAPVQINLPTPEGSARMFEVWESPIIAPGLAERYPEIRTFAGRATDGSGAIVRMGLTYNGFHAYIFENDGQTSTVCPFAQNSGERWYMTYHDAKLSAADFFPEGDMPICGVDAEAQEAAFASHDHQHQTHADNGSAVNDIVTLRKYRVAIAAKGEYTQFHGGTVTSTLSAIVTALNYIVAIQERDWAIRLELIANNDQIIFLDPNTDPYTGTETGGWMNQNPAAINPIIGVDAYDIGHVFAVYVTGSAVGIANISSVCVTGNKGRGCSSAQPPVGSYFYRVAAHEMGHQFSASHTWSYCSVENNESNLSAGTAVEPGSGSTMMSYAGACASPNNVLSDNDDYYHGVTIAQVEFYTRNGNGGNCPVEEETDNHHPTATALMPSDFYIPANTPFELRGEGFDPDGDSMTYCWEETDTGPITPMGMPMGSSPAFRSYIPSSSPNRLCPRIQSLVNNENNIREVLPTYDRVFNWILTVRDNHPGAGGVARDTVFFYATTQAGPFVVTYPNASGITWSPGQYQYVTWDVANTDLDPINSRHVNIRLSTDGGITYPVTLAQNVPNNGKACILVPDMLTTTARIRVESAENIFLDISNANFAISQPTTSGFGICTAQPYERACLPGSFNVTIGNSVWGGYSDNMQFDALNLPVGVTATFTPNPAAPGEDVVMSLEFPDGYPEGNFDMLITATSGGVIDTAALQIQVTQNNFDALALTAPADGASGTSQGPTLTWVDVADADRYEVEVATSPSFEASTIVISNTNVLNNTLIAGGLEKGTAYYWRVRPVSLCGYGEWVGPFSFATQVESCATFGSNDLPLNISTNGTPTIESVININAPAVISDVNISSIKLNHNAFSQVEARLISPEGSNLLLFSNRCGFSSISMEAIFDDAAPNPGFPCPPEGGVKIRPANQLSTLNGQNSQGEWKLRIKDNEVGSGGTLVEFQLEICSATSLNPPSIVQNNPLSLPSGNNALITTDLLQAQDADNTADQLTYTLVTAPLFGHLLIDGWIIAQPGDTWTQATIDAGNLRYYEWGYNTGTDAFRFTVTDGQGGFVADEFSIAPIVGTVSPAIDAFSLTPNPAHDAVRIQFGDALTEKTSVRLTDAAGRTLRDVTVQSGALAYELRLEQIPAGVYTLIVADSRHTAAQKLVVK